MKFTIENVGPIKKSEMEFGDLTILCGRNNTGKTYITYNSFNFFDAIKYFLQICVDKKYPELLLEKGKISIDLSSYFDNYPPMFKIAMDKWVKEEAWRQMAAHRDSYAQAQMSLDFNEFEFQRFINGLEFKIDPPVTKECILHIKKNSDENTVVFTMENKGKILPDIDVLYKHLNGVLSFILNSYFPDTFIITCERTGVACFRPSFLYSPKKSETRKNDYDVDAPRYPRPMQKDWRFVMEFKDASIDKSFIAEEYPEILEYFEELCGGRYSLNNNIVLFEPKDAPGVKLTTTECSSTVRSLMELNFYLKHKAKKRQVLIIDEPELNLHPENQRKMARLIAMLVNAGIFVAITTHSDYVIREFDFMTRLFDNEELAKKIGYSKNHVLKSNRFKIYITQSINKTSLYELKEIPVDSTNGIESTSFDSSIEEMNLIQQAVQLGEFPADDDFTIVEGTQAGERE